MKLAINIESYEALRRLADRLPLALQEQNDGTQRLLTIYRALEQDVGPHAQEFAELFSTINSVGQLCGDTLHEMACVFDSVAQKMESMLHHGPTGAPTVEAREDVRFRYMAAAARLGSPDTDPRAKRLYEAGLGGLCITDFEYPDTPRYNSISHDIRLDARADLHNPTGGMSAYFHETGHMLDHYFANGHAWLSSEPRFGKALRSDFEAAVARVEADKGCTRREAYDIISEEVSGVWASGVSDIFGSLSNCACQGEWGHSRSYWSEDPSRIEQEAFANMFEASIGSREKAWTMKRWFPEAYRSFETIIGGAVQ